MKPKPTDNVTGCRIEGISAPSRAGSGKDSHSSAVTTKCPSGPPAAERLEAAGRLAAWIAHQINNPLGAISGSAQLLARRLQRDIDDPEALRAYLRYLEGIQSQVERCARITGEMLNFTRFGEPDLHRIDIQEVVEEAVELLRYVHPDADIAVHVDEEASLPLVKADREWLARVIFEVASNAVAASGNGPVRLGISPHPGKVNVEVSDSGPGIGEAVLPRIFDPFFSTKEKARGLGLTTGLEMMRKMGGNLRIGKSDFSGTVFVIEVPLWGR